MPFHQPFCRMRAACFGVAPCALRSSQDAPVQVSPLPGVSPTPAHSACPVFQSGNLLNYPREGRRPYSPSWSLLEQWASHQASGGGGASPGLLSGPAAGELGGALAGRGEASPASPSVLDSPCLSLTESLQCRAFAPILKTRRMRFVKID